MIGNDDQLNEWGLAFVEALDRDHESDEQWQAGDIDYVIEVLNNDHEDLTEDQYTWLIDFYTEM